MKRKAVRRYIVSTDLLDTAHLSRRVFSVNPIHRLTKHQSVFTYYVGDRGSAIFEAVSQTDDLYEGSGVGIGQQPRVLPCLLSQKSPNEPDGYSVNSPCDSLPVASCGPPQVSVFRPTRKGKRLRNSGSRHGAPHFNKGLRYKIYLFQLRKPGAKRRRDRSCATIRNQPSICQSCQAPKPSASSPASLPSSTPRSRSTVPFPMSQASQKPSETHPHDFLWLEKHFKPLYRTSK